MAPSMHEQTASKQKLTYQEGLYWFCVGLISHIQAAFSIKHFAHISTEMQQQKMYIKTHDSVSCGPRSRRATP